MHHDVDVLGQPHRKLRLWRAPRPRRPAHVLVADDDARMRELLAEVLRDDGYEVTVAAHGADLLARLSLGSGDGREDAAFGAIVTDVRMPGVTGLEILEGLRDLHWVTPVIIITAFGDPSLLAEARRLGACEVLDKPFALSDFRRALTRVAPTPPPRPAHGLR